MEAKMYDQFIYFLITMLISTKISASLIDPASGPPSTCAAVGTFCTADCKTIFSCYAVGKPPNPPQGLACATINDQHHFCKEISENKAECSEDSAVCKGTVSVKILCGQFGEFPNPIDCAEAVKCNQAGAEPFGARNCPSGEKIDPDGAGLPCVPDTNPDKCLSSYDTICPNAGDEGMVGSSGYRYTCTDEGLTVYFQQPSSSSSSSPDTSDTDPSSTDPTITSTDPSPTDPTITSTDPSPTDPTITSTNPSPTEPTITDSTIPSESTPTTPICSRVDEKFPDPDCCYWYYRCNKKLELEHRKCPQTPSISHYHEKMHSCVNGTCSDCVI